MPSRPLLLVALLALPALAGCATVGTPEESTVEVSVSTAGGQPVDGAHVVLHAAGLRLEGRTDAAGIAAFRVPATGDCRAEAWHDGAGSLAAGDCFEGAVVGLRLPEEGGLRGPGAASAPSASPGPAAPDEVVLVGRVRDGATGTPVEGALLRFEGVRETEVRSGAGGAYLARLPAGAHRLRVEGPCMRDLGHDLELDADLRLDVHLRPRDGHGQPGAPAVRVAAGPGPGQATLVWPSQEGARGYEVLRGGEVVATLPGTTALAVREAGQYAVRILDCAVGRASDPVTVAPTPGTALEVGLAPLAVDVADDAFEVFGPDGTPRGTRPFRVVQGTGNCCENYVATDAAGRIYDFGGTFLQVSEDEGRTWRTVETPVPYQTGEGAVTVAPNGDVLGLGWSPYTGDQLWAHKYEAATGVWHYAPSPLHTPFYDRPWLAVVEGPFEVGGLVVPYVTYAISNFGSFVMYASLDGLHYALAEQNDLSAALSGVVATTKPLPDAGRDWSQPHQSARVSTVDGGHGLRGGEACGWAGVGPDLRWGCSSAATSLPAGHLVVDGLGAYHVLDVDGATVTYHYSRDGATWDTQTTPLPDGALAEEWDVKVSGTLGVSVLAVHAHRDGRDQDLLLRFRDEDPADAEGPRLEETVRVGTEAADSDSGVLGSRRFDFATLGLLPDGRVVMSFTDADRHPPALAVELAVPTPARADLTGQSLPAR